jgi:peptide/nickel transport system substrate-binding protein
VKFSAELCLNPKIGIPCYPTEGMKSIVGADEVIAGTATDLPGLKIVDPATITITTKNPNALLPFGMQDLFILQKATVSKIPVDQMGKNAYWHTPNDASGKGGVQGTGPFMVTGYAAGQSMEVSRNDNYWRSKPFLDKIIRKEFKDTDTALLAFEKGEIDQTYIQPGNDAIREAQSKVGTLLPGPSGTDLAITMNPAKNPDFEKKEVRQAVLSAIDRVSILTNIYHIADPKPLDCIYLNQAFNPPDVKVWGFDPQKAKDLLASAGVDPSKWGEITMDTYYQDQTSLDAMTAIQANLADIGIKVKIQQMDPASWIDRYYGKGTAPGESVMSMIGSDGGPPSNGYGFGTLHTTSAYPKGGNGWNGWHWSFPDLDKALEAIPLEFDDAQRVDDIQQVCRLDSDLQPYINMWATTRYWIVNNRIGNFVSTPGPGMGNYYKAAEMWYIRS